MRPSFVASPCNFANFQSSVHSVSAVQMVFTALDTHSRYGAGSGEVTVNVGLLGGELAVVTTENKTPLVARALSSKLVPTQMTAVKRDGTFCWVDIYVRLISPFLSPLSHSNPRVPSCIRSGFRKPYCGSGVSHVCSQESRFTWWIVPGLVIATEKLCPSEEGREGLILWSSARRSIS